MFFAILKFTLGFLAVIVLWLFFRTWQMEHSANQKALLAGSAPYPAPSGLYRGSVAGLAVSWQGKKFDAASHTGINVFSGSQGAEEKYPFHTYDGQGARDKNTGVLKIDYNIPANAWWLRIILDEIVQTAPGEYLGKVHLRLIPGFTATVGFFKLQS